MDANTIIPKLALALIPGIGANIARALMARCATAEEIFRLKRRDLISIPGIGTLLADRLLHTETFKRAEEEIRFMEKERLDCRFLFDEDYPPRLAQCPDAPIVFFLRGGLPGPDFRMLSVVGTRNPTTRGKQITRDLIQGLADKGHPVVITSGLAYGIDIQAHIAALESGLKTIAVLGHGFHTLYPAIHRQIADRITEQGGLISDFFSHNLPEPKNFIRRNRIIAGLTEATLVVESGIKGGAMVTAEMANSYDRDVMVIPGRPDDLMSQGCNYLIRSNQASLVESAGDIEYLLGWNQGPVKKPPSEPMLFEQLDPDEMTIYGLLTGSPLSVDQICRLAGFPVQKVSFLLLGLEFKELIQAMPGKLYARNDN
ncbi:MAG: DNA-protecting protein DprA [Porphyromonadaceae bacterium]|nr:MAG: DNA-protecting protein DprA [Porphyromonadaceae bacterium]